MRKKTFLVAGINKPMAFGISPPLYIRDGKTQAGLITREASVRPGSVDIEKRTAVFVASTGHKDIRRPWDGDPYYEELAIDAKAIRLDRYNNGAPLLNAHSAYSLESVLGVIERAWIEGGELLTEVRFSTRPEVDPIFLDVQNGILRNVSVGYRVYKWEKTREKDAEFFTYRAIDWEPQELSLVPIGFDPGAQARSKEQGPETAAEIVDLTNERATVNQPEEIIMNLEQRAAALGLTRNAGETDDALLARVVAAEAKAKTVTATDKPVDVEATVRAAIENERTRSETIRREVSAAGLERDFADELVSKGTGIDQARAQIIDKLAKKQSEAQPATVSMFRTGTDEAKIVQVRSAVVDSIQTRFSPGRKLETEMGRHFMPMSLSRLAEECLQIAGVHVSGMNKRELVSRALTTSDFPNILADAMNKSLRAGYKEPTRTFVNVFRRRTAADFKNINIAQLSGAPDLVQKNEEGEYKFGTLSDGKEVYKLFSYGRRLRISREAIINDDLDALMKIPQMFGASAARLESSTVWGIFNNNPTMADGVALFHASHSNTDSAGSINATNVGVLRKQMRKQTGLAGELLDISPAFLICGPDKEMELDQFYAAYTAATAATTTPDKLRSLTPIVEARLTGSNWYVAANYNDVDTIEYCYLEGEEGVYTEIMDRFETGGVEIKAHLDFAAKAADHRGLQRNGT